MQQQALCMEQQPPLASICGDNFSFNLQIKNKQKVKGQSIKFYSKHTLNTLKKWKFLSEWPFQAVNFHLGQKKYNRFDFLFRQ